MDVSMMMNKQFAMGLVKQLIIHVLAHDVSVIRPCTVAVETLKVAE